MTACVGVHRAYRVLQKELNTKKTKRRPAEETEQVADESGDDADVEVGDVRDRKHMRFD